MKLTPLQKLDYLLRLDTHKKIVQCSYFHLGRIDEYIPIAEAIYNSDKNLLGLSFEERLEILKMFLSLNEDNDIHLKYYPNNSKHLNDIEHLYFALSEQASKLSTTDLYNLDVKLYIYGRELRRVK